GPQGESAGCPVSSGVQGDLVGSAEHRPFVVWKGWGAARDVGDNLPPYIDATVIVVSKTRRRCAPTHEDDRTLDGRSLAYQVRYHSIVIFPHEGSLSGAVYQPKGR